MSTPKNKPSNPVKPKKIVRYKALYESLLVRHTALMGELLERYREIAALKEEQTIQVEHTADQTSDVLAKLAALAKAQQKTKPQTQA